MSFSLDYQKSLNTRILDVHRRAGNHSDPHVSLLLYHAQLPLLVRLLFSHETADRSNEFTATSYSYLLYFFCSCAISSSSIFSQTVMTPSRSWATILVA